MSISKKQNSLRGVFRKNMFCPNCGNQIPDGSAFCSRCGTGLIRKPYYQDEINHDENIRYDGRPGSAGRYDVAGKGSGRKNPYKKPAAQKRKSPLIKILAVIAAVLLVFVAVLVILFIMPDDRETELTETVAEDTGADETEAAVSETVRSDIQTAMDAAKRMSGREFIIAQDGTIYFDSDLIDYAYAYYNLQAEAVYASNSAGCVLAVTEDGSLYDGTTLLLEGEEIKDICWKTHNTNVNAYILTENGSVYLYDLTEEGDDRFTQVTESDGEDSDAVTAICRAGSYLIKFKKDGSVSGSVSEDISKSGWYDVVQAACAYDGDDTITTLAAISSDGTVYAQGEYAEDILAMGDLSYIAMTDDASLIVGLKTDGTLAFAGTGAEEAYSEWGDLTDIAGIRLFGDSLHAFLYIENTDGELIESDCHYYLDTSGDFYKITDEGAEAASWMNAAEYYAYQDEQTAETSEEKNEIASGDCGTGAQWVLYEDGELRITGVSDMKKYYFKDITPPWQNYSDYVTSVVIEAGITSLSQCSFAYLDSMQSIEIADTVTSIGQSAFWCCEALEEIVLPASLTRINDSTFHDCEALTSITIPAGVTYIGEDAFDGCGSLSDVYYAGSEEDWEKINISEGNDYLTSASIHYNAQ